MNEAETHAEHPDPAEKAAGWGVVQGSRIRREYPVISGRLEGNGKKGHGQERPVNSMIELKQINGRGTRLFDGKDYWIRRSWHLSCG